MKFVRLYTFPHCEFRGHNGGKENEGLAEENVISPRYDVGKLRE